jgi:hypothetical protein
MKIFGYEIKKIQPAKPLQTYDVILRDEKLSIVKVLKISGDLPEVNLPYVEKYGALFLDETIKLPQQEISYYKYVPDVIYYKKINS